MLKAELNLDFVHQNNQWVLNSEDLNLNPGLYRLKVRTDNASENAPNAVHNLFEVADRD